MPIDEPNVSDFEFFVNNIHSLLGNCDSESGAHFAGVISQMMNKKLGYSWLANEERTSKMWEELRKVSQLFDDNKDQFPELYKFVGKFRCVVLKHFSDEGGRL